MKKKYVVMSFIVMVILAVSITAGWAQAPMFGPEADLKGELTIYLQAYNPREATEADRWPPPQYLWTIQEEYEQIHPNLKINIVGPTGDSLVWIQTMLAGDTAPEVFFGQHREAYKWQKSELIVPIDEYLDMPNPYVEGNKKWRDIFPDWVLAINKAPDGKQYTVNGDLVTTGIFYNKDIFQELGLTVPKTWQDLMVVASKLDESGYIPMSWSGSNIGLYIFIGRLIFYPLYAPLVEQFDLIPEEKPGTVTQKEMALGWKLGETADSDRYRTVLRLQKEFSKYWSPGWLGMDTPAAYDQFITGKAGMYLDGSWNIKPVQLDPYREFEWGIFPFPPVTTKTTSYASEPGVLQGLTLGGPTAAFQFLVASTARDKGLLEEAIDFLMFLSAPQNAGPLITDLGSFMPSIKGAEVSEDLKSVFFSSEEAHFMEGVWPLEFFEMSTEARDRCMKVWQSYMGDQISLDELIAEYTKIIGSAVDRLIAENDWDFSEYGVK